MIMNSETPAVEAERPFIASNAKCGGGVGGNNPPADEAAISFPLKLHAMLEDADVENFAHICSWQPGNKSFKVHDVAKFSSQIMPRYFNQTKFKSFQRQLNIYGYRRIQHGPLKGGYVHKCFVRYKKEWASAIRRKSNKKQAAASAVAAKVMEMVNVVKTPKSQPDILQVKPNANPAELEEVFEDIDYEPIKNIAASVDFGSCNLQGVLERIFHSEEESSNNVEEEQQLMLPPPAPPAARQGHYHRHGQHAHQHNADAAQDGQQQQQHVRSPSGFVFNLTQDGSTQDDDADMNALFDMLTNDNTSDSGDAQDGLYPDLSPAGSTNDPTTSFSSEEEDNEQELSEEQLSERTFPIKLHKMLEHAKRDGVEHIVSWVNEGTGFKVHLPKLFTEKVMPMYFNQTKYESFRRQLNLYSFSRVSKGLQRGVYSHPSFVSGRRDLLGAVKRYIRENDPEYTQKKNKKTVAGGASNEPVPPAASVAGLKQP